MSQYPDDPSTSTSSPNSQTIFADALKQYKKRTKKDIAAHSLAAQIESCDSFNAVLTVLQAQVHTFDPSPSAKERWTRSLHPTITVLCAFSGFVSNIAGPVFPLAAAIFTGIGVLLQAVKEVRAAQDIVIGLFDRMKTSFMRLEKYIAVQPTAAMMDVIVKLMVEVISILGVATKEIVQGQFQKYVKKLFGFHSLEDSFQRLDKFTIEVLTIAARIDEDSIPVDLLQNVDTNIHSVVHEVSFINTGVRREGIRTYRCVSNINRPWSPDLINCYARCLDLSSRIGNESRKDLRQWISPPDRTSKFYTASKAHHEGTAAWCIEGKAFSDWMASGSLFWIHGKPGSGKTILSSVIIRHIESLSNSRSIFLAYFYFDCKDTGKQGSRALLSSLLVQLSNQSDQMCDVLRGLYSNHSNGSEQPATDALIRCLKDMLTIAGSVPIYLVLDALDECPNDSGYPPSREMVLSVVKELVELRLSNLRLCVTSRPEWDIRITIELLATQEISLQDESGQNQDINAYITFVVHSVKHWRDDDKTMVIDKLMEDADGMFRWVYCKLDVLRQCHRNDLRRILKELPLSLDETYQRILKEINDVNPKQAHRLLQCLVAAQRPLRVEELADVLALDVGEGGVPTFNSKSRWEDHQAVVLSTCSSLVSVVNQDGSQVVQFCHTSVKEFLMSDRLLFTEEISQFHITHESSHAILAQACLGVLLSEDDEDGARNIPLSVYAYEYWLGHAQVGNVELQIKDALDRFFDLDKPYFTAFSCSSRARMPFEHRFFRASSDEESKGVLSAAAPYYLAAISGLSGLAERLIVAKKPQVLSFCGHKGTLLHLAVREGRFEAVRLLLAHGADINSCKDYATLPRIASLQRHSQGLESHSERPLDGGSDAIDDIENALPDTNVDINSGEIGDAEISLGERRFTPLHLAASEEHFEICQLLLERNADVRVHSDGGNTPLHLAASGHHLQIVGILLQYNAEVNSRNEDGRTPLLMALSRENALDDGGSTSSHQVSQGWQKGDLITRLVRLLLDYGANVNVYDKSRKTPLHFAASEGHLYVARMLLERNADVRVHGDGGDTPLHLAASSHHLQIVRNLLQYNAEVNSRNEDGCTPLLMALSRENALDDGGSTSSHQVSQGWQKGDLIARLVRLLLDYGANVNVYDKSRNTPLHFAASEGHLDVARMLLELGADFDSQNNVGLTPLQQASQGMREGHRDIVRIIEERRVRADKAWLSPPDPCTDHSTASKAQHQGTGTWFFEGDISKDWKSKSSTAPLLWIQGKPGSGKSVLCSAIIQDIMELQKAGLATVGYFYFGFKDTQKQDLSNALASLLTQLSAHSDSYCDILCHVHKAHNHGKYKPSNETMITCLKEMIALPTQSPVYIVLDALDECPNTSRIPSAREEVLDFLTDLVGARLSNLHICVTCRPEADIQAALEPLAFRPLSIHDQKGQQKDIEDYIRFVVYAKSDTAMGRWRDVDKGLVIDTLSEKANGMFRWVFCQLDALRHCLPIAIRQTLYELPKTLDETYQRVLSEIKMVDRGLAHRLLQCITVAIRPLRVEELAEILVLDFQVAKGATPKLNDDCRSENLQEDILSICSSLLMVADSGLSRVIQFSHFSVKEFLTSDRLAAFQGEISEFYVGDEPAHMTLAQACQGTLLLLDDSSGNIQVDRNFPLARYASQHWVEHVQFGMVPTQIEDGMQLDS